MMATKLSFKMFAGKGRGSSSCNLKQFHLCCRYFSSLLLPESHPFNTFPKDTPPSYHGETTPLSISLLHEIQLQNKHHQEQIACSLRPYFQSQTPHLLRHLYSTCDAIYFWRSLEYWRVAVGEDVNVDVEIGKGYNSGQKATVKFGDYLDYLALCIEKVRHGSKDDLEIVYLAQNELFPQVQNDIPIPTFCCEPNEAHGIGEGNLYHTMLWMGPKNTVSPLHYDPLDNLLIQVVGWKRVLLFPPDDKSKTFHTSNDANCSGDKQWHHAGVDENQYNTSAVDIENPDLERYPNFELAPIPFECTLGPGDALYIPKKWWHHVRSLDFSVSANIWWR
jgi:lysine-specific demethylase 8